MWVRKRAETKYRNALVGVVICVVPCHGDKHVVESGAGPDFEGKGGCAWDDVLGYGNRKPNGVGLGGWRELRDLQGAFRSPFLDSDEEAAPGRHLLKGC